MGGVVNCSTNCLALNEANGSADGAAAMTAPHKQFFSLLGCWHSCCLPSHERSGATVRIAEGYVLLASACNEVARAVSPPAHAPPQTDFLCYWRGWRAGAGSRGLTARQKQTRREQCSVTRDLHGCASCAAPECPRVMPIARPRLLRPVFRLTMRWNLPGSFDVRQRGRSRRGPVEFERGVRWRDSARLFDCPERGPGRRARCFELL